jgi:4-hydroxybenzoate polyprenyltransferase
MIKKSTFIHLRIPFSLYLLPFFSFAVSQSSHPNWWYLILSCLIIHLFFYPSANAFNSYFDKDEGSIGGIEFPPPVDKELLYTSYIFEFIALALALFISWQFVVMLFIINMVFKAYSHPWVRLKKYPLLSLLTIVLFQGAHTYLMSYMAINELPFTGVLNSSVLIPALLCSILLLGSYPMTQIYQHSEDARRGDKTLSRMLGVRGTFIWTSCVFAVGISGIVFFFWTYYNIYMAMSLLIFLFPVLVYFLSWFKKVLKDESAADFKSTMKLNQVSSLSFIAFFIFFSIWRFCPGISDCLSSFFK